MALANFFDRAATAASQILRGFELASFRSRLESQSVALAFDSEATGTFEGRVALDLAINLVARLYPTIAVVSLDRGVSEYAEHLKKLAQSINPAVRFIARPRSQSPVVVVGGTAVTSGALQIYIGSNGWVARLSSLEPVHSGASENPFGAAAAACFGAANVFRAIFADQLSGGQLDKAITFSMLTHEQNSEPGLNPAITQADLSGTCVVGLGAIGNAFVWALARLPAVCGSLDLVDHEAVDLSNLQRYILTDQSAIGRPKVNLAAEALARNGLELNEHRIRWSDYLEVDSSFAVDRLIVAVDSAADRIAMQASLPRWICNAWTQNYDLGISRHNFVGDDACLMCLYLPDGKQLDEDEIVATAFGIPEAKKDVIRPMLHSSSPMTSDLLAQIGTALNINVADLQAFVGKPIRSFYVEAFCGGAIFKMSSGDQPARALVPMAFQSALAGIMLAAETVAHASSLRSTPPPVTTINLLRPLTPYVSFQRKKDPSRRCICQDSDYIQVYQDKWQAPSQNCKDR